MLIFAVNASALTERLGKPLVNSAKTDTIIVAEFLKGEVKDDAPVYAAFNYPVLAYYSSMQDCKYLYKVKDIAGAVIYKFR